MKIVKKLFSRTFIVILAILIQLIIYAVVLERLSESYLYISLPFRVISVLFVLVVINRDMSASFKVPWIAVLLTVPIMGTLLYLFLGYPRIKRSQRKKLLEIMKETSGYRAGDEQILNSLAANDEHAAGQARYISNSSKMPLCKNTSAKYFGSGEEAFVELKKRLSGAKKFIFMEYFIIEEGKMWNDILAILEQKVKEGVDVKVMYDDLGCSGRLKNNYCKVLKSRNIDCIKFNKLTPFITAVHNNRDHRKITVIDGEYAFTGGFNLCDEYINETSPFGYWKDSGVMLCGEGVNNFTIMFLEQFSAQAERKVEFEKYLADFSVEANGYVLPFGDGPAPIYKEYIGEETYLNIINQATRYVYITTPYLIVDYHFAKALKAAAKRGVDVRIITPGVPDKKIVNIMTKSSYYQLVKAGVKIYEFVPGFIHAKSFVSDDVIGVVGTINLDYRSLVHHFECGVWMYGTGAIGEMKTDFDDTLYECKVIDEGAARLKWYQRIVSSVLMLFAPLM